MKAVVSASAQIAPLSQDSQDTIYSLAQLDDHIRFSEHLLQKYQWTPALRTDFSAQLARIRAKQRDKLLNLSVIGEFSSGKSSFLNAMLRTDLLASGILQGTTVASTVLSYGRKMQITLIPRSGAATCLSFDRLGELREELNKLAAENDKAIEYSRIEVTLPASSLLQNRLRVIDTPGLNAVTQWHEEATVRTLREISDLSVILIDALRPLPDSLTAFLSGHLQGVLDRCVFLVTKIDLIRPRERKKLLEYVRQSISVRLGIDSPVVLPYSSLEVLEASGESGEQSESLTLSLESERQIFSHTARVKAYAQTKKMIDLIDQMFNAFSVQMKEMEASCRQRLSRLNETRKADLRQFVLNKQRCIKAVLQEFGESRTDELADCCRSLIPEAKNAVLKKIAEKNSADAVNDYVHGQLKADCAQEAKQMCSALLERTQIQDQLTTVLKKELKRFQREFTSSYRSLPCLSSSKQTIRIDLPEIALPEVSAINLAGVYTQQVVRSENRWAGGGAATGAVIGSAILPGLGTLVGAGIGLVAGLMGSGVTGPDLQTVRDTTASKLDAPLQSYFEDAGNKMTEQILSHIHLLETMLDAELGRYLDTYQATVDKWIDQERQAQRLLERAMDDVRSDIQLLDLRRESLRLAIEKLQTKEETLQ